MDGSATGGSVVATLDEVRANTGALFGDGDVGSLTQELVNEYERAFGDSAEANGVILLSGDGSQTVAAEGIEAADAATLTLSFVYYGNHPAQLGGCLFWKTNGVGGPCGTTFIGRACGWRTASRVQVASCAGGYPGYRLTFN
jgi:hypothetical protein